MPGENGEIADPKEGSSLGCEELCPLWAYRIELDLLSSGSDMQILGGRGGEAERGELERPKVPESGGEDEESDEGVFSGG